MCIPHLHGALKTLCTRYTPLLTTTLCTPYPGHTAHTLAPQQHTVARNGLQGRHNPRIVLSQRVFANVVRRLASAAHLGHAVVICFLSVLCVCVVRWLHLTQVALGCPEHSPPWIISWSVD